MKILYEEDPGSREEHDLLEDIMDGEERPDSSREKVKKEQDIHTYREIVAFTNGEKLDGIEKAREEGKRHYQLVAVALLCAAAGFLVAWIVSLIL